MKIKEYVQKAVELSPPMGYENMDELAALGVRWGFPEPNYGAVLIVGQRGHTNNGIDQALERLQEYVGQLIEGVVENCISVVQQQEAVPEESRKAIVAAIRKHFEMVVH